jgi:hypothetical protein
VPTSLGHHFSRIFTNNPIVCLLTLKNASSRASVTLMMGERRLAAKLNAICQFPSHGRLMLIRLRYQLDFFLDARSRRAIWPAMGLRPAFYGPKRNNVGFPLVKCRRVDFNQLMVSDATKKSTPHTPRQIVGISLDPPSSRLSAGRCGFKFRRHARGAKV